MGAAAIAAAIGEPARARMLYCLMDGHARTSTELSVVADVSPSTASAHLNRLKTVELVKLSAQGKHRYYSLASREVAQVLEGLVVLAGGASPAFRPSTPGRLRAARTCYDHLAGSIGVGLHDSFHRMGWLSHASGGGAVYDIGPDGARGFAALGVDLEAVRSRRRRFACACLDWSERRPHLGGALGAAVLTAALHRGWLTTELDGRALAVTERGKADLQTRFGLMAEATV